MKGTGSYNFCINFPFSFFTPLEKEACRDDSETIEAVLECDEEGQFTTVTDQGEQDALAAGYEFVRIEGQVHVNPQPFTVPLKLYWSAERGDNFVTATAEGEQSALDAGYTFVRAEGYVYPSPPIISSVLKLYWSEERKDNFSTATTEGEQSALAAGYKFLRVEAYIMPTNFP